MTTAALSSASPAAAAPLPLLFRGCADTTVVGALAMPHLSVASFNAEGWTSNWHAVRHLLVSSHCDVLLVQEHWLTSSKLPELARHAAHAGFSCISSSAMDEREAQGMVKGRANGGLAIFFRATTITDVARIHCASARVLAADCSFGGHRVRIVNAYLPWNAKHGGEPLIEFHECLALITVIMDAPGADLFLLAGDFNVDFARQDALSRDIHDCLNDCNLRLVDTVLPPGTITYRNQNGGTAWLDHAAISSGVSLESTQCWLELPPGSRSMHLALFVSVVLPSRTPATPVTPVAADAPAIVPRADWERASAEQLLGYERAVLLELGDFGTDFPLAEAALTELPSMLLGAVGALNGALLRASATSLPAKRIAGARGESWWSGELEVLKRSCILTRSSWTSVGKPHVGEITDAYHRARMHFKYACRAARLAAAHANWEALSCAASPKRFWKKAAAMRGGSVRSSFPESIDGEESAQGVVDAFSRCFADSCAPWDAAASGTLDRDLVDEFAAADLTFEPFTSAEVAHAIVTKMKTGKATDLCGLSGEHLRFAAASLTPLLAPLFTAMMRAAVLPRPLAASVFTPLLKNLRLDASASSSYRGIAVAPTLSRVLEALLLARWSPRLKTDLRQFAYKVGGSSAACADEALRTIEYFRVRKSSVHVVLLDASRAFDKVLRALLCSQLLARGVPAAEVRLLCAMLAASTGVVRLGGVESIQFDLGAGVRQGSLLGGALWAVYVDELLQQLRASGRGCVADQQFLGVTVYADDICLLSPSASGMRELLRICSEFAASHQVRLNPAKSVYLAAGQPTRRDAPCFELDGVPLTRVHAVKYLGYALVFLRSGRLVVDAGPLLRAFFGAANAIATIPGAGISALRVRLLAAYASPFADMLLMLAEHLPPRRLTDVGRATCRALRRALGLHPCCGVDLACAVGGWVPPDCRAGQLLLRPGSGFLLPGRGPDVAALRVGGLHPRVAARRVFLEDLAEDALPRARALRGLMARHPGDRCAKAATWNISTPSVLRFATDP